MESHPVPQNVTAFEFHLIGDMTIKQFTYLAIGVVIAYVTYLVLFYSEPWIAVPIILLSSGTGAAFAFLPIQDRPLDHWAGAFFAAVYSPTQMRWSLPVKKDVDQEFLFKNRLNFFLRALAEPIQPVAAAPTPPPVQAVAAPKPPTRQVFNDSLLSRIQGTAPAGTTMPSDDILKKTVQLANEAQQVRTQIIQTEQQMDQLKAMASQQDAQAGTYTPQVQGVLENLQGLVQKSQKINQDIAELSPHPAPAPVASPAPTFARPVRRILPKLTSTPNVINGIVTDTEGNYLENVVVVIHNQQGLPVRALKTNKLGQFTGSTPLPDGSYTVTLEKDTLEFETIKVELSNKVLDAISISAKRGGMVTA